MMDTAKDKKSALSRQPAKNNSIRREDKTVYDIINSEELDLLYKKNTHLLARLSKTGRENTLLYTKLSSLIQEKSHLGDKNEVLKNKNLSLKGQISLFARQHREFNCQSHKLKEELQKIKKLKVQEMPLKDISREKAFRLFEKKEQVYQKQIQNLQEWLKKKENEKQAELKSLQKDHTKKFRSLEEKTRELYNLLSLERNKKAQNSLSQMKKVKTINQKLNKNLKAMAKELKEKEKLGKNYESKISQMKFFIGKKLDEFNQTAKKLKQKHEKEAHQLKSLLKKKENKLDQKFKKLEKEKLFAAKEGKKIKAFKTEFLRLTKNEENLSVYKNQVLDLTKQKEKLKSGFAEQINLFSKERDALKFQCENLKKALSAGKLGFDQAMLDFQRKYIKLDRDHRELKQQAEKTARQAQVLKGQIDQSAKQFLKEKEDSNNQIHRQKDQHISKLCGELKAIKERNSELEKQNQNLQNKSHSLFLKEKNQTQNEIQQLKWNKEKSLLRMEENHKKDMENLKSAYESRMKNIEAVGNRKLQHIQAEMENDLLSERKRYEIFKDMKTGQIQELKESLSSARGKNHELKTQKFVLEKSLKETKESLGRHLKNSSKWEERNEHLKVLWQELQKQNETKEQKIQSLQKLNRSLSLSLTQKKEEKKPTHLTQTKSSADTDPLSKKKEQQPIHHVLADIHFE